MTSSRPVSACDNKPHNSPQLQPDTNIYQAAASAGTRSSPSRCWAAAVARRHLPLRTTTDSHARQVTWRAGLEFPGYVVQSHDHYDRLSNTHTSATMQAPTTTAARSGPPPAITTTRTTLSSRPDSHRSRAPIAREEGEQLPGRAVLTSEA